MILPGIDDEVTFRAETVTGTLSGIVVGLDLGAAIAAVLVADKVHRVRLDRITCSVRPTQPRGT